MESKDPTHAAAVIAFTALAKAVAEHLPANDADTFLVTITAELEIQADQPGQPQSLVDQLRAYALAARAIPLPD